MWCKAVVIGALLLGLSMPGIEGEYFIFDSFIM